MAGMTRWGSDWLGFLVVGPSSWSREISFLSMYGGLCAGAVKGSSGFLELGGRPVKLGFRVRCDPLGCLLGTLPSGELKV